MELQKSVCFCRMEIQSAQPSQDFASLWVFGHLVLETVQMKSFPAVGVIILWVYFFQKKSPCENKSTSKRTYRAWAIELAFLKHHIILGCCVICSRLGALVISPTLFLHTILLNFPLSACTFPFIASSALWLASGFFLHFIFTLTSLGSFVARIFGHCKFKSSNGKEISLKKKMVSV